MVKWDDFKVNLRACRSHRGLLSKDVAKFVGVSEKAVVDWESGSHSPTMDKAQKLAELFDIPIDHIDFSKEGNRKVTKEDRMRWIARRMKPDTISIPE